jgi:hypothetical protein
MLPGYPAPRGAIPWGHPARNSSGISIRSLMSVMIALLVLQRHVRQLSMAQVIIFQEFKSFLRISIRTWLMDQKSL